MSKEAVNGGNRPSLAPKSAGGLSEDVLSTDQTLASQEVQSKYSSLSLNKELLAGGIENWTGVVAENVDRYGFITGPQPQQSPTQHSSELAILLKLHKNLETRAVNTLNYGGIVNPQREVKREMKWKKMATRSVNQQTGVVTFTFKKSPKLVERAFKGIPDAWRSAAWRSFLTDSARKQIHVQSDQELENLYDHYLETPSAYDVQIDLDVPRTINSHVMFSARYAGGQRLLFRVLHALSQHLATTGYVQGMAPLAASLLCYYEEVSCFVMLVRLFETRHMTKLYAPGFTGLMTALDELQSYLQNHKIGEALEKLEIQPTIYGTKWYLTLFSYAIPFSTQLRIWDVYFLLGEDGFDVLHAASLTLLNIIRDKIIDSDFETAMRQLTQFVDVQNPDLFMKVFEFELKHLKSV
ncbi:rab-GTPase-TBC domain-containing protein [Lipomyces japonicus]|uniref:rab-GTPase-TBC domain-containing protein n=1 Tax=Lipomyces japonicus TaxID=56871 RepID=UPI0034CF17D8